MRLMSGPLGRYAGFSAILAAAVLTVVWLWPHAQPPLAHSTRLAVSNRSPYSNSCRSSVSELAILPAETVSSTELGSEWNEGESQAPSEAVAAVSPLEAFDVFAVQPRRVRPAPPVADRIESDPSLMQVPSLPKIEASLQSEITGDCETRNSETERPDAPRYPQSLPRRNVGLSPEMATTWPYPTRLVMLLAALAEDPLSRTWCDQVYAAIEQLHDTQTLGSPQVGQALQRLQFLVQQAMGQAEHRSSYEERSSLLRVAYALRRRLSIWQPVYQLALPTAVQVSMRNYDSGQLTARLQAVETRLTQLNDSRAWREYLLLDQLTALARQSWSTSSEQRSLLAREFLQRLQAADATVEQQAFFGHQDWLLFADELRQWVCEPVDYRALLDDVERLESGGGELAAEDLAEHYQMMRWSATPQVRDLGMLINDHYRNANMRVAISADLLNRLLPKPEPVSERVDDQLMGSRVLGLSRVTTQLRLVLVPDRSRWQLGLEASGDVASKTETERGPARFHNAGRSSFLVRKLLLIDRRGIRAEAAEAAATTQADLTRLETDLDGVPLVNLLVRAIVKQQYERKQGEARGEAEGLLASRVEHRLDDEVDQKLSAATDKFRKEIWQPLYGLGLSPEAVDMQTTSERLIARYRLAAAHQVAAFTPRPQAPADSLLSIQVHESMLNNVVSSLALGGRDVELRELFLEVAEKLHRDDFQVPDDVPEGVTIRLADHDAIAFRSDEDRIHVRLRISKLATEDGHCWNDFEVRGMYVASVDGVRVTLQRDSYIRLKGNHRRLPMRDQIALRGIFAKVMTPHPEVDLLANILTRDERLRDLGVNQCVIRDGWIGIAVGPGIPAHMQIADGAPAALTH